jgi:hypothetical protein
VTKKTSRRGRDGRPPIPLDQVALLQETYLGLLRLGKTEIEINAVDGMVCWDTRYRWLTDPKFSALSDRLCGCGELIFEYFEIEATLKVTARGLAKAVAACRPHRATRPVTLLSYHLMEAGVQFEATCGIRGKAATDSDGRRPSVPIESDHPIRTKAATLLMG